MLTRLKVKGFKNLVDVDVRFGPFTCIAGANGSGKSNLFDAIQFLSALASKPLNEAALSIRDAERHSSNLRALFHRNGDTYADRITFEAEMVVPGRVTDEKRTRHSLDDDRLHYLLAMEFTANDVNRGLIITNEKLRRIDAEINLIDYKNTQEMENDQNLYSQYPSTTLINNHTSPIPECIAAKLEMQNWSSLHLEPTAMRRPSGFNDRADIGSHGESLARTLYAIERLNISFGNPPGQIYQRVANRLAGLIDGIVAIDIDKDDARELLTLRIRDRSGTWHPARALSDGALRFLAMAILEQDFDGPRLLCLEEPENGIHPDKIPAMLELLTSIPHDPALPVDPLDNPMRQVIITTQSPAVVCQVPEESLLFAESGGMRAPDGSITQGVRFSPVADTWRTTGPEAQPAVPTGKLLDFLNPVLPEADPAPPFRRLVDRPELRSLWLPTAGDGKR